MRATREREELQKELAWEAHDDLEAQLQSLGWRLLLVVDNNHRIKIDNETKTVMVDPSFLWMVKVDQVMRDVQAKAVIKESQA